MSLRSDFDKYQKALKRGVNFIVSPQGGAVFREGMEFVDYPFANENFRLNTFHRGGDESDILIETTAGMFQYWVDDSVLTVPDVLLTDEADGEVLTDEADGEVLAATVQSDSNIYGASELEDLYFTNQEYLGIFCSAQTPPYYIRQEVDDTISATLLPFDLIPITEYNDAKSPKGQGGDTNYTIQFNSFVVGDTYEIWYNGIPSTTFFPEPEIIPWSFGDDAQQQSFIFQGLSGISTLNNPETTVNPVINEAGADQFSVLLQGDGAGRFMEFRPLRTASVDPNPTIDITPDSTLGFAKEPAWSYPYVVQAADTNYYQCIQPNTADADNEPGSGVSWEEFWELLAGQPDWWDYQHGGSNDWALGEVYSPWDRGFPTVCVFHEQRLILAGNPDGGTTLWGSRIGVYDDFTGGPNASDPFQLALDSSDTPTIKWMRSQLNLMIGTSSGDWNVSAQVTIGPTDVQAIKQNNARSHHTEPVAIDTEIFYIEQGKSKLRATRYVRDYNAFTSVDASIMAENLLYDGIKRVTVQYVPEIMMTMVTDQEGLRFLTYQKEINSAAWMDFETFGDVIDVTGYFDVQRNEDVLYLAVLRQGEYFIEKMPYPSRRFLQGVTLTEQGVVLLDSWVSGTVDGFTITGLENLEGQFVELLINDALQEGGYLVENGTITLDENFQGLPFAVGLPYAGEIETFEVPIAANGTGFGTKRRWNQVIMRLLDSALPKINGELPPDRKPIIDMGTPETITFGLQNIEMIKMDYGDGSVVFRQDKPYPTNIIGFYGEYRSDSR